MKGNIVNPKNKTLFKYLRHHCLQNGINLYHKVESFNGDREILVLYTDHDQYGSIGFDSKGKLICVARDRKIYRWAIHEGFSEDEVFSDDFLEPVLQEVSLDYLASVLSQA
jgi:hypothetical protein